MDLLSMATLIELRICQLVLGHNESTREGRYRHLLTKLLLIIFPCDDKEGDSPIAAAFHIVKNSLFAFFKH